jgi:hypothetical protein
MEVAVMSLSAREKHALDSIESSLVGSDPGLASMLDTFTRLTSGEAMPAGEKVSARRGNRLQCQPTSGSTTRLAHRLGRAHAAVLVWLVISLALLATAITLSRTGSGTRETCGVSLNPACGRPAPMHRPGSPAVGFGPGTRSFGI